MNELVRQQFRRRYGVDPRELFDQALAAFLAERRSGCTRR